MYICSPNKSIQNATSPRAKSDTPANILVRSALGVILTVAHHNGLAFCDKGRSLIRQYPLTVGAEVREPVLKYSLKLMWSLVLSDRYKVSTMCRSDGSNGYSIKSTCRQDASFPPMLHHLYGAPGRGRDAIEQWGKQTLPAALPKRLPSQYIRVYDAAWIFGLMAWGSPEVEVTVKVKRPVFLTHLTKRYRTA